MAEENKMEKIVSLCKQRGFIFPGSEIYGGLANSWDYGPLGVELKRNFKNLWWQHFIQEREDMVGLDSSILMNPRIWEASGHTNSFADPLIDCKECHERFRGDKLLEAKLGEVAIAGKSLDEINTLIKSENIKCPSCGNSDFTEAREFNLMFKTFQGVIENNQSIIYLRPETAQGIFVNFKNILNSTRKKLPFGVGQIGKSFRNEITPGNFTFRTREFEQMEIEYFVKPGEEIKHFENWTKFCLDWYIALGIKPENLRVRQHEEKELSHYSNKTVDIEYKYPFGWGELEGIASRTNFDLNQHIKYSGAELSYFDPKTNEKFVPYVIEPAFGLDRSILTILIDAYEEQAIEKGTRKVLHLNKRLAPIKLAILPLKRNEERIVKKSREIFDLLKEKWMVQYDDTGSIGKLYRRQDEIGTPYCLTVDFETIEKDNAVTIRDRDTMEQKRIKVDELVEYFSAKL